MKGISCQEAAGGLPASWAACCMRTSVKGRGSTGEKLSVLHGTAATLCKTFEMMTLGNVSESTANIGCELVARCAVTRRHSARARAGAARASARFEFLAGGSSKHP